MKLDWLGLPEMRWTLALAGLWFYTFVVVTYYVPGADVGVVVALAGIAMQIAKIRMPYPVWMLGAFVFWALLSALLSPYGSKAVDQVIEQAKLLAILFIVVNALQTEGQLRGFLLFFLGCFILFPVRGVIVGSDSVGGRVVWNYIYNNPNDLASLCLIALGVAVGVTFARPSAALVRLGAGICGLLLLVVLLLTQSRGAFIGFVVGFGPALIKEGLRRPVGLVLFGVTTLVVIAIAVPQSTWTRLSGIGKLTSTETIAQADTEGSAEQRFAIQQTALRIFLDRPILGVGFGAYPAVNATYSPELGAKDTHNTYLNLAAEVGVPGLLLWLALMLGVLIQVRRIRRSFPNSALAVQQAWIERSFVAYLVAGFFGSYAKLTFPYLLLGVLWVSANLLSRNVGDGKPSAATLPMGQV